MTTPASNHGPKGDPGADCREITVQQPPDRSIAGWSWGWIFIVLISTAAAASWGGYEHAARFLAVLGAFALGHWHQRTFGRRNIALTITHHRAGGNK